MDKEVSSFLVYKIIFYWAKSNSTLSLLCLHYDYMITNVIANTLITLKWCNRSINCLTT